MIWSIDGDGPDFQAILSGAIGDYEVGREKSL
jgi:hypothetical protein